ncbi:MAG: phytoene desaturase family protein [Planctomycetota bacterium]
MSETEPQDCIVIGASIDGLVAATYLARAGRRVLVLEPSDGVSGAARTEELWPGVRVDALLGVGALAPEIASELGLARHGLVLVRRDGLTSLWPEGALCLPTEGALTVSGRIPYVPADIAQADGFARLLANAAGVIGAVQRLTPPTTRPGERAAAIDWLELAKVGARLRGLGRREMLEVLRTLTMSIAELANEWFAGDALKGALGALAVRNTRLAPFAGGTVLHLLHQLALGDAVCRTTARGGIGALNAALERAARAAGVRIERASGPVRLLVSDGCARGVVRVADGREYEARQIVASCDAQRAFVELVDPCEFDPEFLRALRQFRSAGSEARVHLLLSEPPEFPHAPAGIGGTLVVAPTLRYLEDASDAAKYGEVPAAPFIEASVPTWLDPTLASRGRHVISIAVHTLPRAANWGAIQEQVADAAIDALATHSPNLQRTIVERVVLTPDSIEARYGLTGGHLHGGEFALDQWFLLRPIPGWNGYRTPIEGYYLCGASTHPASATSGLSGRNAARVAQADVRGEF